MADEIDIVVATIAFGTGIDKPNIRNVVNWDLSSTLEEYNQQTGRAGRDGEASRCLAYVSPGSFYTREVFARGDLVLPSLLRKLVAEICRKALINGVLGFSHAQQAQDYDIPADPLKVFYAMLELHGHLVVVFTGKEVALYQREQGPEVAQYLSLHQIDLIKKLSFLHNHGHINLQTVGNLVYSHRVVTPLSVTQTDLNALADKLFSDLQAREESVMKRTNQVIDLMTGTKCFCLGLAEHFVMTLPNEARRCGGHCTYCLPKKPAQKPAET